ADHPNRLLVTATPEGGDTYAEVAHEAIYRRWEKLRQWIAAERAFLAWRSGLEVAYRAWLGAPANAKNAALLMGHALVQAQDWLVKRVNDLSRADREFIARSLRHQRVQRVRAATAVVVLAAVMVLGTIAWTKRDYLQLRSQVWLDIHWRKMVLPRERERT